MWCVSTFSINASIDHLILVLLLSFIILTLSRKMLTKGQIYFKNTYFLKYVWPFFNIIHEKGKYPESFISLSLSIFTPNFCENFSLKFIVYVNSLDIGRTLNIDVSMRRIKNPDKYLIWSFLLI